MVMLLASAPFLPYQGMLTIALGLVLVRWLELLL